MELDARYATPRRKKVGGNMSAVNAFLMECAASPDSPFPATTLSAAARQMAPLPRTRRASDGEAVDEELVLVQTPPALARKGEMLKEHIRSHGPTPPSNGSIYSHTSGVSYNSVASSSSNLLTDSSTLASGGSTARTPDTGGLDSDAGNDKGRKLYGSGLGLGVSSRSFARTASAPVGKNTSHFRDYEGKMLVREDLVEIAEQASPILESSRRDETGNISTTVTLTAAPPRPSLTHTSSASSLTSGSAADKVEAYKTPNHASRYQTARSTDRTKLLSRSTLKGFGGPVKRSKVVQPMEDGYEENEPSELPPLPDIQEGRTLRRPDGVQATTRSTTPYGEPPQDIEIGQARGSPPRSTIVMEGSSSAPVQSSLSHHHRMSPPRKLLENIPDTIPEDVELPAHRISQMNPSASGSRSVHTRSISVSPDPTGISRTMSSQIRHRHSPSVPATYDKEYEKENRVPGGDYVDKLKTVDMVSPPQTFNTQSLVREEVRRTTRTPEQEQRSYPMEISEVDRPRAATVRVEGTELMHPSVGGLSARPASAAAYYGVEAEQKHVYHQDLYAASTLATPIYQTPAQAGPLRQAQDYGALQSGRSAPPVPPQNYYTEMAAATPASALPAGRKGLIFNGKEYERISLLGKGGSSKVYSVLEPGNRKIFALKRVQLDRSDAETITNYLNEIDLLKRLSGHDRIIQLIDHSISYTPSGRPKILQMMMELGEIDFAALLENQREKPLNMNFVALYWQQMLEAVQAVHDQNVVHTDLKPANFVLVKGKLKIIDFGIAKAIANDTVNIHRDTQIGTVNYMSPEAILKMSNAKVHKLSFSSDVWSLGCILYQMIYGGPPFQGIPGGPLVKMQVIGSGTFEIPYPANVTATRKYNEEPASPSAIPVTVPSEAIDTIQGCLTHSRDARLAIPALLEHPFLKPKSGGAPSPVRLPADWSAISKQNMTQLVKYVLSSAGQRQCQELGEEGLANFLFQDLRRNINLEALGLRK